MSTKTLYFVYSVLLITTIDNAHGDWKFWKSKTTTTTTTVAPVTQVSPVPINSNAPTVNSATANAKNPNPSDPARPRPPNPGTEVGLDISRPKPNPPGINTRSGQGYRDWAVDLTGAGGENPNQPPKLPSTGPVLSPGQLPQPIPSSNQPSTPSAQGKITGTTPRPPTPQNPVHNRPPIVTSTTVKPIQIPSRPVDSVHNNLRPSGGSTNAPTPPTVIQNPPPGGKSWAQVVGEPKSPTPTPATRPSSANSPSTSNAKIAGVAGAAGIAGAAGVATMKATTDSGQKKIYSSNPTFSKGNTVTDEDLEKLAEALFIKDTNNAFKHIRLNLQKQTSSSNLKDESPEPLLTVNSAALQIPTIQRVIALYDNYQLDTKTHEYISPAQREEESLLVDTFLSTNVMSMAMRFLADKGFVRKDYYEYKDTLRRLWFNLYSRGEGKVGSAGFEHVFLTEVKLGTEVSGLHNWIYFNAEEVKKRADYLGYMKKLDLGENAAILKLHAKFNGIDKPVTTMFIGTSPELEMALYTVCYFARPDSLCPVSLGGSKFNIQTYKFKYRGKELIGSAYPEI